MANSMSGIGVMSGSSLDGLDVALVSFTYRKAVSQLQILSWYLDDRHAVSFPGDLRKSLDEAGGMGAKALLKLDSVFGQWIGDILREIIADSHWTPSYIALHGQTIFHYPGEGFGYQLGSAPRIAQQTGLKTITDFRSSDLAAGGLGAPLAPVCEHYLLAGHKYYLNLGGIANISMHDTGKIRAWDICAANQLLNYLANKLNLPFDEEGKIAASGTVYRPLLEALKAKTSHSAKLPFAMDNTWIKTHILPVTDACAIPVQDKLATASQYIASVIADHLRQCQAPENQPATMLVTGGGVFNTALLDSLKRECGRSHVSLVVPSDEIVEFKEAILMALLGLLRLEGMPNCFASVTGASTDTINGAVYSPQPRDVST